MTFLDKLLSNKIIIQMDIHVQILVPKFIPI